MKIHDPLIFPKIEIKQIDGKTCWRLDSPYPEEEYSKGKVRYGIYSMWVDVNTKTPYCTKCYSSNLEEMDGIDWGGYCCRECDQEHNDIGYVVFDSLVYNLTEEDLREVATRSQYLTEKEHDALCWHLIDKHKGNDLPFTISYAEDKDPKEISLNFNKLQTPLKNKYHKLYDFEETDKHGDNIIRLTKKMKKDVHFDFKHTPNTPYIMLYVYEFFEGIIYEEIYEGKDKFIVVGRDGKRSTHTNPKEALKAFTEIADNNMRERWNEDIKDVQLFKKKLKDDPDVDEYWHKVWSEYIDQNPDEVEWDSLVGKLY